MAQLADLRMPGALEALDDVLAGFDDGKQTTAGAIKCLLAAQISLRNSRRIEAGHALEPPAAREDAGELRLQLSALDQARTDRRAA